LQRRDAIGTEARIDTLNQHEASREQPRAYAEHQSSRHFHDHNHAAHAPAGIASSFLESRRGRRPRELNRGCETGDDRSQDNHAASDRGGAGVNGNAIDACDIQRPQSRDQVQCPSRQRQPCNTAQRRQQEALHQHLPDQPATVRANGLPHCKLPAARHPSRHQQIRRVGACDDQQNHHGSEEQWQHVAQAAYEMRSQRHDLCGNIGIGLRIFPSKLRRQSVEFRLRFGHRDARPKPAQDIPKSRTPTVQLNVEGTLLRHPHQRLRLPLKSIVKEPELEVRRQNANDAIGPAPPETHGLTDNRRIAAETIPPHGIAENRDASALLKVRRLKCPAQQHRCAEHREELLAHKRRLDVFGFAAGDFRVETRRFGQRNRLERPGACDPIDRIAGVTSCRVAPVARLYCQIVMTRSASGTGRGRRNRVSATLIIAVVAPMPIANTSRTIAVKPGVLSSMRTP
jgi:hypothetical protein